MSCLVPIEPRDLLGGGEGVREFGHIADEVDDLLDIVVAEEVMSRSHIVMIILINFIQITWLCEALLPAEMELREERERMRERIKPL